MQIANSGIAATPSVTPREARVLIVEDEMIVALALQDMVTEMDFDVAGVARSVEEATRLLDECDIAIVDYHLHGGPADLLAKLLQLRGIPYALSTGGSWREMESKLPDALMLPKPYSYEDVQQALMRMCSRRWKRCLADGSSGSIPLQRSANVKRR